MVKPQGPFPKRIWDAWQARGGGGHSNVTPMLGLRAKTDGSGPRMFKNWRNSSQSYPRPHPHQRGKVGCSKRPHPHLPRLKHSTALCDQCGADYRYDPATGKLTCDHCGHETQMAQPGPWASNIRELDLKAALQGDIDTAEIETTRVSICLNCAAQVELAERIMPPIVRFAQRHLLRTQVNTGISNPVRSYLLPWMNARRNRPCQHGWDGCGSAPGGPQEYARKGRKMQGFMSPTGPLMRIQNHPIAANADRFITKHAR